MSEAEGAGTREDPWVLKTPPGSSEYTMYRDEEADPPELACQVGSTKLSCDVRAVAELTHDARNNRMRAL